MRTGLLSGGAAALFGEVLSPLYLPATVYRAETTYGDDGEMQRTSSAQDCRAQVDAATERMRENPEYTSSDRAIYILASTFAGELDSDAEITVHAGPYAGTRWRLQAPIERDPCGAYWLARGTLARPA